MALEHGVMLSKTSPSFLHANSTSHTWSFSAIAEIIDNAYDPDVGATELRIDKVMTKNEVCLAFTDNGAGMTPEKLHRMLSFGYCEKVEVRGHKPVGQYGNGFKSGSMRLGKDAVVFTKNADTWSVGFLSQTFLEAIKADTVLVPIITVDKQSNHIVYRDDTEGSLKSIFAHSIFKNFKSIMNEYANLDGHETGTRIIIYNLKRGNDGMLELDFNSNLTDIRNSEHHEFDQTTAHRLIKEYTPEYRRSLREYCSILFLKPRMKIIIQGEKVRTKLISKSLQKMEVALYRPRFLPKPVKIILGFSDNSDDFGIMLYHRNRLIKAYERVGCQKQQTGQGIGVVGVVEVDFLEPIHNKQDFNKTDRYNACMNTLAQKLNDYCQEKTNSHESQIVPTPITTPWTWAQCDNPQCLKWRRLPSGVSSENLPEKWFCYMNLDPTHNRCDIDEEPEDEDALIEQGNTYEKRVKKQKTSEQTQRTQAIAQREETLRQKEQELLRVKTEIESLQPLQENSIDGHTRVELEQAKQQLEEAKCREEQQKQIIEELQRQKHQMELQQKRLGNAVMGDRTSITTISNIAQNGVETTPGSQRKRKTSENAQSASKVKKARSSAADVANPEPVVNAINSDATVINVINPVPDFTENDDDTCDIKPHLVVKFTKKSKANKSSNVIVIDSDSGASDDELPPVDSSVTIKHEIGVDTMESGLQMPGESVVNGHDSFARIPDLTNRRTSTSNTKEKPPSVSASSSTTVTTVDSLRSVRKCRHVKTQTVFPDNSDAAVLQLDNLRKNVAKLLRVILPDMEVFVNIPLENVDNALIEVLRVNNSTIEEPSPRFNKKDSLGNASSKEKERESTNASSKEKDCESTKTKTVTDSKRKS